MLSTAMIHDKQAYYRLYKLLETSPELPALWIERQSVKFYLKSEFVF
jgi:hypothetical protein